MDFIHTSAKIEGNTYDRMIPLPCLSMVARQEVLNVSLKSDNKMFYIPNKERVPEYLSSIVSHYETGEYDKFKPKSRNRIL